LKTVIFYQANSQDKCCCVGYLAAEEIPHGFTSSAVVVESIPPKPEMMVGKNLVHYINPITLEQWYEYENIPATEYEILTAKVDYLTMLVEPTGV
jgi:hypothetical protein